MSTHISGTPGGTRTHNRLMAVHNNNDILMVHYEDLPDGDKDVIGKAIEELSCKLGAVANLSNIDQCSQNSSDTLNN